MLRLLLHVYLAVRFAEGCKLGYSCWEMFHQPVLVLTSTVVFGGAVIMIAEASNDSRPSSAERWHWIVEAMLMPISVSIGWEVACVEPDITSPFYAIPFFVRSIATISALLALQAALSYLGVQVVHNVATQVNNENSTEEKTLPQSTKTNIKTSQSAMNLRKNKITGKHRKTSAR